MNHVLRSMWPHGLAALTVCVCWGCQTTPSGSAKVTLSRPVSFSSAPSGEHVVGHAPGVCDLCDLYYQARNSVVRVRTSTGQGAGIVVTEAGRILTNAHVVEGDDSPVIESYAGGKFDAKVLRADRQRDLVLIEVSTPSEKWTPLQIDSSAKPLVGSDVYVIGHPVGLGWTVSRGIISGTRASGEVGKTAMIQTDAAISPGNSGGPLLDRDGHLLGVVVAKLSGPAIGNVAFAIPAVVVNEFLNESAETEPAPSEEAVRRASTDEGHSQ